MTDDSLEATTHRLASLALEPKDVVVVVGLAAQPQHNYAAARVLEKPAEADRVPVALLHGDRRQLSVRRRNLIKAARPADRDALLVRVVWERQLELRVAAEFLLGKLHGEEGLCLHIASFFPPRETLALTTGYAMGRIVSEWSCISLPPAAPPAWAVLHGGAGRVFGADESFVRMDCAVVGVGRGRFVVAGGCGDHPSRCNAFYSSAWLYDALTHSVERLPDMPCARHGCGGAHVDGRVYVFGGEYVARGVGASQCAVLDLASRRWSALAAELPRDAFGPRGAAAFMPVGAVWGRLLVLLEGALWAFNTRRPQDGWMQAAAPPAELGSSSQACVEWGDHLVVSQGRGSSYTAGCYVAAFGFLGPPDGAVDGGAGAGGGGGGGGGAPAWHRGEWARLGDVGSSGRVGADMSVVHDRLYISGGAVDNGHRHGFDATVCCWAGSRADLSRPLPPGEADDARAEDGVVRDRQRPWRVCRDLQMPVAMHAHSAITIPLLPGS